MSAPDDETLRQAVNTLWFGFDETIRERFSSVEVLNRSLGEDNALVGVELARGAGLPRLIVSKPAIEDWCAKGQEKHWRSELARQMRQRALNPSSATQVMRQSETSVAGGEVGRETRPSQVGEVLDGWFEGRATAAPQREIEPERESVFEKVLPVKSWSPFKLVVAPIRVAFRKRQVSGWRRALVWSWRALVVSAYVATFAGAVILAHSVINSWSSRDEIARAIESPDGGASIGEGVTTRETPTLVKIGDALWSVPPGWTREERSGSSLLALRGPERSRIDVEPMTRQLDRRQLAQICAGGERAQAAFNPVGLEFVEVRYRSGGQSWIARCYQGEGVVLRGAAPSTVFSSFNIGDWLLLTVLDHQIGSAVESRPSRGTISAEGVHNG